MNIWIINPFDSPPGDSERLGRYRSLANTLVERGHTVTWWTSKFSHGTKQERDISKNLETRYKVVYINCSPYSKNISLKRIKNHHEYSENIWEKASENVNNGVLPKPDRIIVSVPPLASLQTALKLKKQYKCKVIFDIQDAWPETFYRVIPVPYKWKVPVGKVIFAPALLYRKKCFKKADAITGVADMYINLCETNLPKKKVPIGIYINEVDKYLNKSSDRHPLTFVYLGSISANYDLATVLMASKILKQEYYQFKVLFAGIGPDEDRLKSMSKSLQLEDYIEFRGFLDFKGVVGLLSESDVALNTIVPESFIALPNKIADYLSGGLAVINSITGELAQLLENQKAGISYKAYSPESLASQMRYYIDNPDVVALHGENARYLAEQLFDRAKTYPEFARFIEEL